MKNILLLSLNFLPNELKAEYKHIQSILSTIENGPTQLVSSNFEEQENICQLILTKNRFEIEYFLIDNKINNIIVSSQYYPNRPNNEEYYSILRESLDVKAIFITHSNGGDTFPEFQKRISINYPHSPSLFLSKVRIKRQKIQPEEMFKNAVNEYFV